MSKANAAEFEQARRRIAEYAKRMSSSLGDVVYQVGEQIITDVRATRGSTGVPRDTGTLANSLRAVRVRENMTEISAGGAAAPYALVQHERTDFRHKLGEARYLVRGVERWNPNQARRALKEASDHAARYAQGSI